MELKDKYLKILKSNQRMAKGFGYTVPSSFVYPHQWLWDSCFHSIIYARLDDYDWAKDEVRALLAGQWGNGMIPHIIYRADLDRQQVDWGTEKKTSSITQPPMVAYAVEFIYQRTQDKQFVQEVFEKLDKYYQWLDKERSDDYILSIIHPWESGQDNFVPWDSVYGVKNPSNKELNKIKLDILKKYIESGLDSRKFMNKNVFNVKCLLFNSVYLRNLSSMLNLAKIIGSDKTEYYQQLIGKVKKSFKKHLYNREKNLYTSFSEGQSLSKDFEVSSIFLPLFAGVLTEAEAKELVNDYLTKQDEFWPKYPVPTVSANDQYFRPDEFWRGSVCININWFIYRGLKKYNLNVAAQSLRDKSFELVEKSGFCEYFNPINGKGYGPSDFCWSGLIFDME